MKSNINPLSVYRETTIRTASQGKLIVMLYDEAIKHIDIAVDELKSKNRQLDGVNNAILKAQDVITELMVSLDFDRGGDLARNLFNLYFFFNGQLMEANFQKTENPLIHVRKLLSELRESWIRIANNPMEEENRISGGVNIAG